MSTRLIMRTWCLTSKSFDISLTLTPGSSARSESATKPVTAQSRAHRPLRSTYHIIVIQYGSLDSYCQGIRCITTGSQCGRWTGTSHQPTRSTETQGGYQVQTEQSLSEHKQQSKLIFRRITPNSEPRCSIESGAYTLQCVIFCTGQAVYRWLPPQLPHSRQRCLPHHSRQVISSEAGLFVSRWAVEGVCHVLWAKGGGRAQAVCICRIRCSFRVNIL